MHILIKNSNTNLLHTYRCLYARMDTHTTSAFHVSWPDKSNQTHKRYTLECNTAWVPVVWMYSLFSLPLSSSSPPPSAFFPPWFGRGAASCAPALLLSRFCPTWCPDVASRREEDWTGMRYVQYVTVAICSGIIVTWHSIEDYGLFSDPYASKNPLGVALTRTWYTAVDTRGY